MSAYADRVFRSLWMVWERGFDAFCHISSRHVTDYGICKLLIKPHKGASIQCDDGSWIHHGDWVGELHISNHKLNNMLKLKSPERVALETARLGRRALRDISDSLFNGDYKEDIKALIGITMLHRGIIHGAGFELHPLQAGWFQTITTWYLRLLMRAIHPMGKKRVRGEQSKLYPMQLIMPVASLFRRYPPCNAQELRRQSFG